MSSTLSILTEAQSDGLACARCGRTFDAAGALNAVPVIDEHGQHAFSATGSQLFRCESGCVPAEPVIATAATAALDGFDPDEAAVADAYNRGVADGLASAQDDQALQGERDEHRETRRRLQEAVGSMLYAVAELEQLDSGCRGNMSAKRRLQCAVREAVA